MKVTVLGSGTSQGIPVIGCHCKVCQSNDTKDKRFRSSIMVEIDNKRIIIDTGPDFRSQILRANVDFIRAILITHEHKDHLAGLDDVRAFNYYQDKKELGIDVFASERTTKTIKNDFAYAFTEHKYPGVPEIKLHLVDDNPFYIDDIEIIPIPIMHYKLRIYGYRIGEFAYITDGSYIPEESMKLLKGTKTIIINALRKEPHPAHFCLSEALKIIKDLNVESAYLTHIGHQMGLYKEVSKELPANVALAYDTQEIYV